MALGQRGRLAADMAGVARGPDAVAEGRATPPTRPGLGPQGGAWILICGSAERGRRPAKPLIRRPSLLGDQADHRVLPARAPSRIDCF